MKHLPGSIRIYDNGGASFDRFTVLLLDHPERQANSFTAFAMSEHPQHPQGFGQHTTAMPGRHLGKRIHLGDLPQDCRLALKQLKYT